MSIPTHYLSIDRNILDMRTKKYTLETHTRNYVKPENFLKVFNFKLVSDGSDNKPQL